MNNILMQDAISLALMYCNMADYNRKIISLQKVELYKSKMDNILYEMGSQISEINQIDYSKLIYFNACDENDVWYAVLKNDIDIQKIREKYIYKMPYDIIKASQQEEALEVLGLQLIDGEIVKIDKPKIKSLGVMKDVN